jgi:multidrug efflux pump subunit AcrA (membrane-fusion protein)
VSWIAETPGTNGVDGYHIYFEVRVDPTPTPLQGFSVRLTIPIQSTAGEVTVVPLSAVSLAADGTSRVQVQREGGLEYLVVEPGLAADGFVEVTPAQGTLSPGELVVVGWENPEPATP